MNFVSRTAVAAALGLCSVSMVAVAPTSAAAQAQPQKQQAEAAPKFSFTKPEEDALYALQEAIKTKDPAIITPALAAATTAAQGADARYALATLKLDAGRALENAAMQSQAVDELIASGRIPAAELPNFLRVQVNSAIDANDVAKAEAALTQLSQLQPNDADTMVSLARLRLRQERYADAASLLQNVIGLEKAAGETSTEGMYRTALGAAERAGLADQSLKLSQELVRAYPKPENWSVALKIFRKFARPDKAAEIDSLRLMRFTRALDNANDFILLAERLNTAGYPGEATTVLEEGVASNKLNPSTPGLRELRNVASAKVAEDKQSLPAQAQSALSAATGTRALSIGDAYFGYGDYSKAIELYRAALQKGSVDANVVNTRLGMALALSGKTAEAQAAFESVSGSRTSLAELLKLWASQRA